MRVVKIEPPGMPKVKDIPNTLEALQTAVGGYIETVQLFADRDFTFVCNEEGRIKGLAPNCFGLVGTVLAVVSRAMSSATYRLKRQILL